MNDVIDAIIYYDELTTDQQIALRSTLEVDNDLLQLFNRWQRLKRDIRDSLHASLPDRNLLVLYALQQNKENVSYTGRTSSSPIVRSSYTRSDPSTPCPSRCNSPN